MAATAMLSQDGQPVDVQQVVFDAGKLARVQFFEDVQRNQAHRDPAQGEDAARAGWGS